MNSWCLPPIGVPDLSRTQHGFMFVNRPPRPASFRVPVPMPPVLCSESWDGRLLWPSSWLPGLAWEPIDKLSDLPPAYLDPPWRWSTREEEAARGEVNG